MKTVAVIDGHHMLRRAYHTREELTDYEGNRTGGIFGFMDSVRTTLQELRPDGMLIAFDGGTDPWRRQLFPGYKDRKDPDPKREEERLHHGAAVAWQVEQLFEHVLPHFSLPIVKLDQVEADDLIFIAREYLLSPLKLRTVVVSGDKDFLQMIKSDTHVFDPMTRADRGILDGPDVITPDNFREKTELSTPGQFLDFRAIIGDSSDRIPGIKGVGKVTALNLIQQKGSLRNIYNDRDSVRAMGKRYASVADNGPIVARNLALMGLHLRKPRSEEIDYVRRSFLAEQKPMDQKAIKSYCLAKGALDFTSNLPELLLLLNGQHDRMAELRRHLAAQRVQVKD